MNHLYSVSTSPELPHALLQASVFGSEIPSGWYSTPWEALQASPIGEGELRDYILQSFVYAVQVKDGRVSMVVEKLDGKRSERFYSIRGQNYRKNEDYHASPVDAVRYSIAYWTKLQSKRHPMANQVLAKLSLMLTGYQ